ncbi:MAG: DUF6691 family protein [Flavobacteriaceae bacterium]
MKYIKFLIAGIVFGIILSKSEAISWYRIYEMFKFQSFHMYGIIGSAVVVGIGFVQLIKKTNLKNTDGNSIEFTPKKSGKYRNIIGGMLFGFGWALAGACPGPFFVLLGSGVFPILIVILGALIGVFTYHATKSKLPH